MHCIILHEHGEKMLKDTYQTVNMFVFEMKLKCRFGSMNLKPLSIDNCMFLISYNKMYFTL